MKTYKVTIGFGGYIGATNEYEVDADSKEEAEETAIKLALDDLSVEDIEDVEEEEDYDV